MKHYRMDVAIVLELIADSSSGFTSESETSSSESDDDILLLKELAVKRPRILNPWELTIGHYSEGEFLDLFGMSQSLAKSIIEDIREANAVPKHPYGPEKISPEKAFLMTLWHLSNQESFRQNADHWHVSLSSAYRILQKITDYFASVAPQYIKWPNNRNKKIISQNFRTKMGISGVIGVIDSSHITIKKPKGDSEAYFNQEGSHSIILQAVVDHNKCFTDIYCGEPGSIHNHRLLEESDLFTHATTNKTLFGNYFLLGNSSYPSLVWLVPPLADDGNLSEEELLFNRRHSSSKEIVEEAFSLLKNRFKRLNKFDNNNLELIIKCVTTACVLHNISLKNNEEIDGMDNIDSDASDLEDRGGGDRRMDLFKEMFSK